MKKRVPPELDFHERLAALRTERGLTQHTLTGLVEMHTSQIRRYESGQLQPRLQSEAASGLDPEENVIRSVIESIVLRNTVKAAERRFTAADTGAASR